MSDIIELIMDHNCRLVLSRAEDGRLRVEVNNLMGRYDAVLAGKQMNEEQIANILADFIAKNSPTK